MFVFDKLSEPSQELKSFQIGRKTTPKHKIINLKTASVFHGIYEYLYAYVRGNWDGKPCITEDGTEDYVISFL